MLGIFIKMNESTHFQYHPTLNSGKRGACFNDVCHLFQSFKPTLHVLLTLARLQHFQYAFLFIKHAMLLYLKADKMISMGDFFCTAVGKRGSDKMG